MKRRQASQVALLFGDTRFSHGASMVVTTSSDMETSGRFVISDAADVSLIQASQRGLEAVTRLLQTYNAGVNVADVLTAANNDQLNVENVATGPTHEQRHDTWLSWMMASFRSFLSFPSFR
ncbi:MAG TPA: hypothetical protein VGE39_19140 [Prosthecobacter sp.]